MLDPVYLVQVLPEKKWTVSFSDLGIVVILRNGKRAISILLYSGSTSIETCRLAALIFSISYCDGIKTGMFEEYVCIVLDVR